ncbi:MAG: DUF3429 domain-containing protein [Parvularculaceae bacterium]|nr:DUF3429 domain-containing protein [Parvularculaceae bacterium]
MDNIESQVDVGRLKTSSAAALGFGGVLPFWVAPFTGLLGSQISVELEAMLDLWIVLYAAIIVSFMSGGRWAFSVLAPDTRPGSVFGGFLGAVTPALAAWVIAALPSPLFGYDFGTDARLVLLAGLLILQLLQDSSHTDRGGLPLWYMDLRTLLVIGATTPLLGPPLLRALGALLGVSGDGA